MARARRAKRKDTLKTLEFRSRKELEAFWTKRAKGKEVRIDADTVTFWKLKVGLLVEATPPTRRTMRSGCRVIYTPGGGAPACGGPCVAGKMCVMEVKESKSQITFKCKCATISTGPVDPGWEGWDPEDPGSL
jgi:hypothetical protein